VILSVAVVILLAVAALEAFVIAANRRKHAALAGVTKDLRDSQEKLQLAVENEQGEKADVNDRQSNH
jgi:type II secretory pathway pseudopilin PulG